MEGKNRGKKISINLRQALSFGKFWQQKNGEIYVSLLADPFLELCKKVRLFPNPANKFLKFPIDIEGQSW